MPSTASCSTGSSTSTTSARRVQGNLGHYMTYSGVIMLVACIAVARVMFRRRERIWAALVLPAVLVALVLTLSRNAWVGACAGIGTLFVLRDIRSVFRMAAILPVALGLLIAFAPSADQRSVQFGTVAQRGGRRQRDQHVNAAVQSRSDRHDQERPADRQGQPADRRRPRHGDPGLSRIPRADCRQPAQLAPAQCAAADRRRARPAGPGTLAAGSSLRSSSTSSGCARLRRYRRWRPRASPAWSR